MVALDGTRSQLGSNANVAHLLQAESVLYVPSAISGENRLLLARVQNRTAIETQTSVSYLERKPKC